MPQCLSSPPCQRSLRRWDSEREGDLLWVGQFSAPQVATASGTAPPRAKLLLTGSQQMRCTCGGKLELESR